MNKRISRSGIAKSFNLQPVRCGEPDFVRLPNVTDQQPPTFLADRLPFGCETGADHPPDAHEFVALLILAKDPPHDRLLYAWYCAVLGPDVARDGLGRRVGRSAVRDQKGANAGEEAEPAAKQAGIPRRSALPRRRAGP